MVIPGLVLDALDSGNQNRVFAEIGLGLGDDFPQAVTRHRKQHKFLALKRLFEVCCRVDGFGKCGALEIARISVVVVDLFCHVGASAPESDVILSCTKHCETGSEAAAANYCDRESHGFSLTVSSQIAEC